MKAIRSAILVGLACCLAATSGLARETSSHSKSSRSEKTSRSGKKKSATTASRKSKARKKEARVARTSETERLTGTSFSELPPEDLPEPEADDDSESGD